MSLSTRGEGIAPIPGPGYSTAHTYDRETNPGGLVAPAFATNDLVHSELAAFASKITMTRQTFSTTHLSNGSLRLRTALSAHLNETFRPWDPIEEAHIVIADTATAIFEILGFTLCNPGDGILTSRPIYRGYVADFGTKAGVEICFADTDAEESLDPQALVVKLEEALVHYEARGTRIRGVMISNPNNPLGRCYPRTTLVALMKFCHKHTLHLISDEIFGASVFFPSSSSSSSITIPTTPFTSILSVPNDHVDESLIDLSLLHVVYGLAKDFSAPSLRIGALVSQHNPRLLDTCKQMLRFHDISGPSCGIATAMLEDREWCRSFLARHRDVLRGCYEYATNGLRELGVKFVEGGNAGFFVFIDLSPYLPDTDLVEARDGKNEKLAGKERYKEDRKVEARKEGPTAAEEALVRKMVEHGVYLPPGAERYDKPGWFRFVFTYERDVIDETLRRLRRVITT